MLDCEVTKFGLVLKDSSYKGTADVTHALILAKSLKAPDAYKKELVTLISKYRKDNKASE